MTTIDPKWISYDDNKLTVITEEGVNKLTIRDDIVIVGLNAEQVNGSNIQIRTAEEGAPTGTPGAKDMYIEVP